jgi:hypothetical protein
VLEGLIFGRAERGLIDMIHPDSLIPEMLISAVVDRLRNPRSRRDVDCEEALRSADVIEELPKFGETSRPDKGEGAPSVLARPLLSLFPVPDTSSSHEIYSVTWIVIAMPFG